MLAALHAAYEGFIYLNRRASAADRLLAVHSRHVLADFMADPPRRLVRHAKLALEFFSRNAVPCRREQVHRIEPKLERRAGLFEGRANGRVQVVAATAAGIGAFGLDSIPAANGPALGALVRVAEAGVEQVL